MSGALREVLARFGITADTRQLDRADRRVSSTTRSLRGLVAAAGGAATLMAMRRFVTGAIAMGDDIDKTSQQIGLSTQELQAFSHAAELSGVDTAGFANAMGQLQKNARDAAAGVGEYTESFEALGIQSADLLGPGGELLGGADILRLVADGMQNTTNTTERTALAMEIMGRSGRRMLPMLTSGREGLAAMEAELAELGGGASQEFIQQSVAMTDELTRMRLSTTSLKSTLLTSFLPAMTRVVTWMTRTATALSNTGAAAAAARPILVALGVAALGAGVQVAIAWGAVVAPILVATAAAAMFYLVFDDIITTAEGGDTVTRTFLDWAMGAENATQVIRNANQAVEDLRNALSSVAGFFGFEVGEEGTDRRRANERGAGANEAMQRGIAAPFIAADSFIRNDRIGGAGRAPRLSAADQRELADIQADRRAVTSDFNERFPELNQPAPMDRGVQSIFDRFAREDERQMSIPRSPDGVGQRPPSWLAGPGAGGAVAQPASQSQTTIHNNQRTDIVVNAAEDPAATARIVGRELDRREASNARAVLAVVEPEGAT